MADYSLVVNSRFQPFSFERYLQPYQIYGQEYKAQEAALEEIANNSGKWENLINEQTDPELYNQVVNYNKELDSLASGLVSSGLSPTLRQNLLKMKSRYKKEFDPIEEAYKRRQGLIDQQRNAILNDDTLMFDVDYSTTSLSSLMNNPSASFKSLSGNSIAKRTALMAKEAAKTMLNDPEYKSVFGSQYVQQKIMQGYDMSQVIATAQRDPNAPKELLGIVDTIKKQVNYDKWSTDNKKKIDGFINEGLDAAIGTPKIDLMSNKNFESDMDRERMDLAKEQFEYETKGIKLPDGSYYKPLGGNKVLHTKPDGSSEIIGAPAKKEDTEKGIDLSSVTKVSDMKGTGFTPVGAVVVSNGMWVGGREGEDIPEHTTGIGLKTNLKSGAWGNFSYNPKDSDAEATIVTNLDTIPGAKEWNNGSMELSYVDRSTAFGKIIEQARLAGISDEEFSSDNVIILKVKARGGRSSSESPYDYIIYRKS